MRKQIIVILLMIVINWSPLFAADIHVSLNKTKVGLNQSFSVVFSTSHPIQMHPDFSPLNQDFDVLSNSYSNNTSLINGKITQEMSWNLILMAKHEGLVTLPTIKFGHYQSLPKTVEITAPINNGKDESIFIEIETFPEKEVFEHSQLIYIIRLYRSVNITQGTLSAIKTNDSNAIIEKLTQEGEYEYFHPNGTRYLVAERSFAIFPQHAGELIVEPTTFEGSVVTSGQSFFNMQTELKRVKSEATKINVKSIPSPFTKNDWLAANSVKLTEEWSIDPKELPLGEPITWTLTLTAEGCAGSLIPPISLNLPKNLKQYLDKPVIETDMNGEECLGTRQMKVAIIATKKGQIEIPEIVVKWWNLTAEKIEETKLPARTILIIDEALAMNTATHSVNHAIELNSDDNINQNAIQPVVEAQNQTLPLWVWGLLTTNGLVLFIIAIIFVRKRMPEKKQRSTKPSLKEAIKNASLDNNAKQVEGLLIQWAATHFPLVKSHNLVALKPYLPISLQEAIEKLHQSLYSSADVWNGESFWKEFKKFKPSKSAQKTHDLQRNLVDLYPE